MFKLLYLSKLRFDQLGAAVYPPPPLAALGGHLFQQSSERLCPALPGQPASGRFCLCRNRRRDHPSNSFPLALKSTDQNSGRHFPGLTRSLLSQLWDSKGTSPFGRNPWHQLFTRQPFRADKKSLPKAASGLSGFTRTTGERAILSLPTQTQKTSLQIRYP